MIKHKEANKASDLASWKWLSAVVDRLGTDGMSSDDSSMEGVETVYRVKNMAWRRDINRYLDIIDDERKENSDIYCPQGAKPIKRIRGHRNPVSTRAPVQELPRTFYDDDWYGLDSEEHRLLTLNVSEEAFTWFNLLV
jgi:hypothetical protein